MAVAVEAAVVQDSQGTAVGETNATTVVKLATLQGSALTNLEVIVYEYLSFFILFVIK